MGHGNWDSKSYANYTRSTAGKTQDQVFTSRGLKEHLDPRNAKMRESRDSPSNPESTPIIVALDLTGSMGHIADFLAREGLGKLFDAILAQKPVTDPHLMFMGVGDAITDQVPLQVSQFEADGRIVEQLVDLYIEGHGGGNATEGYNLPWYFAAAHTVTDRFEKRGKKGFLFTIGDECAPNDLTVQQIERIIGDPAPRGLSNAEILQAVQARWNTFHVVIEEGSFARRSLPLVMKTWRDLLDERVLPLSDYKKLTDVIVAAISAVEGFSPKTTTTDMVVQRAVQGLAVAA